MNTLMSWPWIWVVPAAVLFGFPLIAIVGIRWLAPPFVKSVLDLGIFHMDFAKLKKLIFRALYIYLFIHGICLLIPWGLIVSSAGAALDQYFRNTINEAMSPPALFDSISLSQDEYKSLPLYWRQALAEIGLRPNESAAEVKGLVSELTMRDIELINLLAPYAVSSSVIRDNNRLSEHPMPELSYRQMLHLESLGVIEDVNNGMKTTMKKVENEHSLMTRLIGSTLNIVVISDGSKGDVVLNYSPLTRGGSQLIEALQVPTNGEYFEWIARSLEEQGVRTEIRVTGILKNGMSESRVMQAQIVRTPKARWPAPE